MASSLFRWGYCRRFIHSPRWSRQVSITFLSMRVWEGNVYLRRLGWEKAMILIKYAAINASACEYVSVNLSSHRFGVKSSTRPVMANTLTKSLRIFITNNEVNAPFTIYCINIFHEEGTQAKPSSLNALQWILLTILHRMLCVNICGWHKDYEVANKNIIYQKPENG